MANTTEVTNSPTKGHNHAFHLDIGSTGYVQTNPAPSQKPDWALGLEGAFTYQNQVHRPLNFKIRGGFRLSGTNFHGQVRRDTSVDFTDRVLHIYRDEPCPSVDEKSCTPKRLHEAVPFPDVPSKRTSSTSPSQFAGASSEFFVQGHLGLNLFQGRLIPSLLGEIAANRQSGANLPENLYFLHLGAGGMATFGLTDNWSFYVHLISRHSFHVGGKAEPVTTLIVNVTEEKGMGDQGGRTFHEVTGRTREEIRTSLLPDLNPNWSVVFGIGVSYRFPEKNKSQE